MGGERDRGGKALRRRGVLESIAKHFHFSLFSGIAEVKLVEKTLHNMIT